MGLRIGEAYAFFNCPASQSVLELELRNSKYILSLPSHFSIQVSRGMGSQQWRDHRLLAKVNLLGLDQLTYGLHASQLAGYNQAIAEDLHRMMQLVSHSPIFVSNGTLVDPIVTILYLERRNNIEDYVVRVD